LGDNETDFKKLIKHGIQDQGVSASCTTSTTRLNRRDKFLYDVSIQQVSAKGPLPKCCACGGFISRKSERVIVRGVINVQKNWYRYKSFHRTERCLQIGLEERDVRDLLS
jgi:hypothetical protein